MGVEIEEVEYQHLCGGDKHIKGSCSMLLHIFNSFDKCLSLYKKEMCIRDRVKLEISSTSHPFYTGKSKLVDTAGRVDKFMSRYGNRKDVYKRQCDRCLPGHTEKVSQ